VQLIALGIGAIIGTGIFVLTGWARRLRGAGADAGLRSRGLGCAFAGLCYAEFAAMIPLAGSAYTYGVCDAGRD
jgi:APA family basic amino acid/polyamine antiporter